MTKKPEAAEEATYENVDLFRQDEDTMESYNDYLWDHDQYRQEGGILYADDLVTWLNFDYMGLRHRDRILQERNE